MVELLYIGNRTFSEIRKLKHRGAVRVNLPSSRWDSSCREQNPLELLTEFPWLRAVAEQNRPKKARGWKFETTPDGAHIAYDTVSIEYWS